MSTGSTPVPPDYRQRLGSASEDVVAREMIRRGYRVVERNHSEPWGEMDLLCRNEREIVVVEVRSRLGEDSGDDALESISAQKRRHVRRAAEIYLASRPVDYEEVRFFVAVVTWDDSTPTVRVIEDAF